MTNIVDQNNHDPLVNNSQCIAEFSLRLVYPFSFTGSIDDFSDKHLQQQTIANMFSDRLPMFAEAFKSTDSNKLAELKKNFLWQRCHPAISKDLYPHIRQLLRTEHTDLSQCYELSDEAWQLLDGAIGRSGKGLAIDLSPAAISRLGLSDDEGKYIPFSFCRAMNRAKNQKPQLYLFGFGEGLLTVELSIDTRFLKKHQTSAVLEFIHATTHISLHSSNTSFLVKEGSNPMQQTLNQSNLLNIFWHLLGQNSSDQDNHESITSNLPHIPYSVPLSRFFSYAALRLDRNGVIAINTDAELMQQKISALSYSMAHRQTAHYLPTSDSIYNAVNLSFSNIAHSNSIEGGAVVIDTMYFKNVEGAKSAIKHNEIYIRNTIKNAYWPLILLSYLEFTYLIKLTSADCPDVSLASANESTIKILEELRSKMLSFRLHFRYSQASQLAQHNRFYERWRQAFGSDNLADELADDILQINNLLTYKLDKDDQALQERQNKHFTVLGIWATTLLTTIGIFGTNFQTYNNEEFKIISQVTGITLAAAFVSAFIASYIYLRMIEKK